MTKLNNEQLTMVVESWDKMIKDHKGYNLRKESKEEFLSWILGKNYKGTFSNIEELDAMLHE